MKKGLIVSISRVFLGVVVVALLAGCRSEPPSDKNGKTPEEIAAAFLNAVKAGDYDTAATYWTKQKLQDIRSSSYHNHSFTDYCHRLTAFDSFQLERTSKGKGVCWHVGFKGLIEEEPRGEGFLTCILVGNRWYLVELLGGLKDGLLEND